MDVNSRTVANPVRTMPGPSRETALIAEIGEMLVNASKKGDDLKFDDILRRIKVVGVDSNNTPRAVGFVLNGIRVAENYFVPCRNFMVTGISLALTSIVCGR